MKKTFTTLTLALVLTLGSTFTFASGGIIVSDATGIIVGDKNETKCDNGKDGIIVGDIVGIIVGDIVGIIVGDKATPCSEKDGIIVGDATGIIVGD
ncbi:MAG: hypothetical protein IPI64_07105 [Chloracidobacterium sp.]|nr:hypothetical protein [Chloracidobacterium sp.]